ncbi:GreA/GreB family elongation factor [Candidatus Sumerlaeota bacterium]|nr:GreA/GreB family elongation factor [Candidatus Sumerlaeota bacterium]
MNEQEKLIIDMIKRRQHDKAETVWLNYCEKPGRNMQFYMQLVKLLAKSKNNRRLNEFGGLVVSNMIKEGDYRSAIRVGRLFIKGLNAECAFLPQIVECVRKLNEKRPRLDEYIQLSKLEEDNDTNAALNRLDVLLYNDEGEVFAHDVSGIGVITVNDTQERKVLIEFENGETKEFNYDGVRQFLYKYPAGHFHALRMKNKDKLKKIALSRPLDFMRIVLRSHDKEIRLDELKELLTHRFLKASEWQKWWRDSRDALMLDPYIEFTGGARGAFKLRETPRELDEELAQRFRKTSDSNSRLSIIKEAHKQFNGDEKLNRLIALCEEVLREDFQIAQGDGDERAVQRIELAFLWEDLHAGTGEPIPGFDPFMELSDPGKASKRAMTMSSYDHQTRVLERFAAYHQEEQAWTRYFAKILSNASPRLATWIIKQLDDAGEKDLLHNTVERIVSNPAENPEMCIWAMKQAYDGKWDSFYQLEFPHIRIMDLMEVMRDLYNLADQTPELSSRLRGTIAKVRNFLWDGHCKFMMDAIDGIPVDDARKLRNMIRNHPALNEHFVSEAMAAFRKVRDDLIEVQQQSEEELIVYVTAHTLANRQTELRRITTEDIPRTSEAIGRARELGDLRENAEYHAARDDMRVLMARKDELTALIQRARIIEIDKIGTNEVNIGTRFIARNLTLDEEQQYTILGLWDADPERGILNYRSPLAEQFLGKKPDVEFEIEMPTGGEARYIIRNIERAELPVEASS